MRRLSHAFVSRAFLFLRGSTPMYRPNAPPVLLKKAVIRTVPGQAPGNETSFRLKNGPQPARRRQSVTVSPMYGLFSAEAAENFALNKKCIKFARCLKRRKLHTVDVAQSVRASDCGSESRGFEPHLPPLRPRQRGRKREKDPYVSMICEDFFLFRPLREKAMKSSLARPYPQPLGREQKKPGSALGNNRRSDRH